jgi:hypothetical protein
MLFLIRYDSPDYRRDRWQVNVNLHPVQEKAADWKHGVAAAPSGQRGNYAEFEVGLTTQESDRHEQIWWDNALSRADSPFALLLPPTHPRMPRRPWIGSVACGIPPGTRGRPDGHRDREQAETAVPIDAA